MGERAAAQRIASALDAAELAATEDDRTPLNAYCCPQRAAEHDRSTYDADHAAIGEQQPELPLSHAPIAFLFILRLDLTGRGAHKHERPAVRRPSGGCIVVARGVAAREWERVLRSGERTGSRVLERPDGTSVEIEWAARAARIGGRRVVITGDTAPSAGIVEAAWAAEVLVTEATFLEEERGRAEETLHQTAAQAGELARSAEVGLLALTHLSNRYLGRDAAREARTVFPATVVPKDFDTIEVGFEVE